MLKVENTTGAGDAGNNWLSSSRRDRVWMCDACDLAPAAFVCKADSASLCAACDSDIHSANPLARRHIRVPISSTAGNFYGHSAPGLVVGAPEAHSENDFLTHHDGEDEDEAASWLLLNPVKNEDNQSSHDNTPPLFGGGGAAVDAYLDLDDYNSCQNNQFNDHHHYNNNINHHPKLHYSSVPHEKISYGGHQDSVVPIQIQEHCFPVGLDYESSHTGYSYPTSVSSHNNVCLSPVMDVGVVPESTMSEGSIISGQYQRTPKGTIDLFSGPLIPAAGVAAPPAQQLSPVDREARVMRYREKKKMRKFEKTIRYASRKAYAETRPRVKGRFAKRSISCAS